jgi:uncharacterized membrane protein YphA (DoxX/SURF4 family)/thiol-disulfide isomerase/thioredoxin
MATAALGLRLLLAAVFLTAGVGKLFDLAGSRRAVSDFGVPERFARIVGVLLPVAEVAVGIALIFQPSARWAAALALVLLLAFIAGIGAALARGEQPDCHCFGQIHSAPAGRGTLIRNAALAAIALIVLVYGSGSALDTWIQARTAAELAAVGLGILAIAISAYALMLRLDVKRLTNDLRLARRAGAVGGRFGLPVGSEAPMFSLEDINGQTATLNGLLERGRPVLLLFMTPWCGPCSVLLPKVHQWQETLGERLTVGVISSGTAEQNAVMEEHGLQDVFLQEEMEVAEAYSVKGTPSAVFVSSDGRIASRLAEMEQGIEPLVRVALRHGVRVPADGSAA